MKKTLHKLLAIFLILWLPFFAGGALAMNSCPQMQMTSHDMDMSASEHANHGNGHSKHQSDNLFGCDQCGLCHVACSPGLTSTLNPSFTTATSVENPTARRLFRSITLPFPDPPPLVL